MRNRLSVLLSISLVLFIGMGCGLGGLIGGSEKDAAQKKSGDSKQTDIKKEVEPSGEIVKVGIQECDELATYINDNSEEIEGSYLARGIVYVYKNYIISKIKEGVENMSEKDKEEMGKVCKKSFDELKKSVQK